jgi:HAD superfamily hydrolase (TIGR01484 family)
VRYLALVSDYDGTLAHDGVVDDATVEAVERVRASGRRVVLVTGRELDDLQRVFPRLELFDRVVAENGALLYRPEEREEVPLGEAPSRDFVDALQARRVDPLSVGRVIVATWHPNEDVVLDTIRELGLELQVIFNKGAVMVLPSGINKASGLQAALAELRLSPHNALGIGDAENDHAFLTLCECAVAVANALPALKERCDLVTDGDHGRGVSELAERLLATDLQELESELTRHDVLLGARDGQEVLFPPYGRGLLVAGPSGSGKSSLAGGLLERLAEAGYQFCLVDPEGDYESFAGAVTIGDAQRPPRETETLELLERSDQNVVVNLLGQPLDDRPGFFQGLLPQLQALRSRVGRPHWLVVDEAHHMLPSTWQPASSTLPREIGSMLLISVHPDAIAPAALAAIDAVVAVGEGAEDVFRSFAALRGLEPPTLSDRGSDEVLLWWAGERRALALEPAGGKVALQRHRRKYAEGELGEDKSFYFRGPDGRLNLRAQNLVLFLQLAEGVDDETWLHHLRAGDYSRWVRSAIKDDELATEIAAVEKEAADAAESRARIRELVEVRYTLPSRPTSGAA